MSFHTDPIRLHRRQYFFVPINPYTRTGISQSLRGNHLLPFRHPRFYGHRLSSIQRTEKHFKHTSFLIKYSPPAGFPLPTSGLYSLFEKIYPIPFRKLSATLRKDGASNHQQSVFFRFAFGQCRRIGCSVGLFEVILTFLPVIAVVGRNVLVQLGGGCLPVKLSVCGKTYLSER